MPGVDGATLLHRSMKQDYKHINKHIRVMSFISGQPLVKLMVSVSFLFYFVHCTKFKTNQYNNNNKKTYCSVFMSVMTFDFFLSNEVLDALV